MKNVVDHSALIKNDTLYFLPSDLPGIEVEAPKLATVKSKKESLATGVTTSAAAKGITHFEIAAVQSVTYPELDPVLDNQFSTNQDHGGGQVRVYVFQFGYGNPNNATFAGSSVSATSSTPRCGSNLTTCSAGETVTGFLYQFDFFGASNISGTVNVSANSVASPFGFWSDSVYVQ